MNIVFVHNALENLGIEYLSAQLKKKGHNVSLVFDPVLGKSFRFFNHTLGKLLSYEERIIRAVNALRPDLVCFSVFSDNYPWACRKAQKIKEILNTPIIFGGIHATLVPDKVIENSFVDYVCVGEGEYAICELLDNFYSEDKEINNIWYKKGTDIMPPSGVKYIEDLDSVGLPDKDLFFDEYPLLVESIYSITTSRNCIFKCTYCHNNYLQYLYNDSKYLGRRRSIAAVIEELVLAKQKYNITRVGFYDDLFISDPIWLKGFLDEYKQKINLPFFCTVHTNYLNMDVVALLSDAGCSVVNMGVQTLDEDIKKRNLNRHEKVEDIAQAVNLFKKTKIFVFTDIIFGLPDQDEREMINIISFFNKSRPDFPDSNWLRYYPKTEIIKIALEKHLIDDDMIDEINQGKDFSPYSLGGHTRNRLNSKFRNLLSVLPFMPKPIVNFLLKYRLYAFMPTANLRDISVVIVLFIKRVFHGKKYPYPHLSPKDFTRYYLRYIFKKISSR